MLSFDQNTWFVHDKNRDMEWTYDELVQDMTHDEAVEIFDLVGKDHTLERLTYEEVKAIAGNGAT